MRWGWWLSPDATTTTSTHLHFYKFHDTCVSYEEVTKTNKVTQQQDAINW
jgi:hypothetical protein